MCALFRPVRPAQLAGACAALALAATARAQGTASRSAAGDLPYDQTLSVSPLFLPFGTVSGEYERKLGVGAFTVAATGTYNWTTQLYPRRDRWAEGRLMYYPGGHALEGFAVGVTAGAHRAEREYGEGPAILAHDGAATLGAVATYNYFYGRRRRLFFGPGLGFKHVLKSLPVNSPLSPTYFEARAALGIAF